MGTRPQEQSSLGTVSLTDRALCMQHRCGFRLRLYGHANL